MSIIQETIYRVRCDKCGAYLTHVFDDFTLEEEDEFYSAEQCKRMLKEHDWLYENHSCICPDCQKEMTKN
jgi:DNA-directed RNA polymerase subunit N (RpoN/RPB10)